MRNYILARKLLLVIMILIGNASLSAQLLVEDFDYAIGSLLTSNSWTAHSGAGTAPIEVTTGLSFAGYAGSGIGGAANIDDTGEDINKPFTAPATSGTVYAAFIMQTETTNYAGYFFNFGQTVIGSTYISRVWVNASGTGVGISGSTAPLSYVTISAATPILVVVKYDIASKISSLYVLNSFSATEPTADATFTETSAIANIGSVALRQFNAAERIVIDGIRVGTTWSEAVFPSVTQPTITVTEVNPIPTMTTSAGNTATQTINVGGVNLTDANGINLTISGTYANLFTLSTINIPQTNGIATNTVVTIIYSPISEGSHTATLTMISNGATDITRDLTGITSPATSTNIPIVSIVISTFDGNILFTTTAGETVSIYNSMGQMIVSKTTVEGLNKIPVALQGVAFIKVGNRTAKIIL